MSAGPVSCAPGARERRHSALLGGIGGADGLPTAPMPIPPPDLLAPHYAVGHFLQIGSRDVRQRVLRPSLACDCCRVGRQTLPAKLYTFTTLNVPGASYTIPTAVNDSDEVAGYFGDGRAVH